MVKVSSKFKSRNWKRLKCAEEPNQWHERKMYRFLKTREGSLFLHNFIFFTMKSFHLFLLIKQFRVGMSPLFLTPTRQTQPGVPQASDPFHTYLSPHFSAQNSSWCLFHESKFSRMKLNIFAATFIYSQIISMSLTETFDFTPRAQCPRKEV